MSPVAQPTQREGSLLTADLFAAPAVAALAALLQAAAVVDAVVVREATGLERWASVLFSIATIVIAIALIVLAAAIVGAALAARRLTGKVQQMMERSARTWTPSSSTPSP
jgi:TRAP-type C4-dicarboxylate transport system permease large subunit